jgi:hypothetical protein
VIESDAVPGGSTALSAGLIPVAGTRFQRANVWTCPDLVDFDDLGSGYLV